MSACRRLPAKKSESSGPSLLRQVCESVLRRMDEVEAPEDLQKDGALPDEVYSPLESVVLWSLLAIGCGVVFGLIVAPETVWDEGLAPVVWDPIVEDASDSGDAGYNRWNTALYTAGLFAAVLALQALFRRWRLPSDDLMLLALTLSLIHI